MDSITRPHSVTLRLGVFFDGTGKSCQDVDPSNIALLYDLYPDHSEQRIPGDASQASLAVYVKGIGLDHSNKRSLFSQATGRGSSGVLARVEHSGELLLARLLRLKRNNPQLAIQRIEVDLFGFSRGAAAARHLANDLRRTDASLWAKATSSAGLVLASGFSWRRDLAVGFVGLFDTVAGIVDPLRGDFDAGNGVHSGLDLEMTTESARKVVQLVARDECRYNFSLIHTAHDLVMPGAHSDIGGGYPIISSEQCLLSKPVSSLVEKGHPHESTHAYREAERQLENWRERTPELADCMAVTSWAVAQPFDRRRDLFAEQRVYAAVRCKREVAGHLSRVYLRIMREIAVNNGVPFLGMGKTKSTELPAELEAIADKLLAHAVKGSADEALTYAEEALLKRRYIHLSAHWNAAKGLNTALLEPFFIDRPTETGERNKHA